MKKRWEKGSECLCALFGGLYAGGMICRLFLTPGDAYAPLFPAMRMIFVICFFLLLGFCFFLILRRIGPTAFAVAVPLLWLSPLLRPTPIPEMLAGFVLGGMLAVLGRMRKTALTRLLLIGSSAGFIFAGWLSPLCGRFILLGIVATALCGIIRIACRTQLKFWRYPLILLLAVSAAILCRRGDDAIACSVLPPPPLFAASLMPTAEEKVDILLVSNRLSNEEKPLEALPYVNRCTVLPWKAFSTLCTTGESAQYDLVALDVAPGRSGAYKCEALRQGMLRTRKGGGVFVYPGNGRRTPVPEGAIGAVSLPWDDNRYFAAALRTNLPVDQEQLDDRLQRYQNAFDFELFPAGVFTALYHGGKPEFTLSAVKRDGGAVRVLPAGWWRYAAAAAFLYCLLRVLLCRRERFGAIFAAQENAISFGTVVFAAVLQGSRDFFSPVPAFLGFGMLLLPLLAFRTSPIKGVLLLTAGWIFPLCWLLPAAPGDWRIAAPIVIFSALSAGYSCFRQTRPGWTPPGTATGQFLLGLLLAAVLVLTLQALWLPLLPLAAAVNLILRTGVTLRS